jgi:predicted Fe-Mo cluster-binding NifX family protein
MKIAISTNDGLSMAPDFEHSERFLIMTIVLGEIVDQEMRHSHGSGKAHLEKTVTALSDCSGLIVRNISDASAQFLTDNGIPVISPEAEIITNVIVKYLERGYRVASDTCCCP